MNVKMRKAEQAEATRGALLAAARELFTQPGYAAVATEEIVQRAGVTRGALYHHFAGKRDLFKAVFEQLEQETAEKIATAALTQTDTWQQQLTATQAFLDCCLDPAVQRIALVDAPSVLGLETWREIESIYGLALVRAGLEAAVEAGLIERQPVEPLAHLILGALIEAGLMIAYADDVEKARTEVGAAVERLLTGLRA
jgi:AcrR family transcriptional regulator